VLRFVGEELSNDLRIVVEAGGAWSSACSSSATGELLSNRAVAFVICSLKSLVELLK
jgi:hypothetical protein